MSDLTLKGLYSFLSNYSKAREASNEAERLTNNTPGWSTNGYGDAARHAIASGLIARRVSPEAALSGGALHELLVPNESDRETDMDYRNNRFGAQLAPQFPSDEEYIRYIQGIPDRYEPRDVEGALSWYGKPKSSEMKKASGGTVKSTLQRYQESFPQRRAEANRQASVMSQADEAGWQPEYQREPALEPPMISPDDLIGSGIPTKLAMLAKAGLSKGALAALGAGVIKNKGGNWLSGSVEGALSGLKKRVDPELEGYFRRGQNMMPGERAEVVNKVPINDWIDRQLTRYVRNEMATPEDPVRALAERGVLHVDPDAIPIRNLVHPSGEETRKLGVSEAAKRWENRSDRAIAFNPASDYQDFGHSNITREHPWVAKLDPTTPMYRYNTGISTQDLGFDHLIDELSNAINPESGLPRNLQLDPKSLERVSVPQAVERVHSINLWRAAMKAEADAAKANNAATVLHKEYPDKGMKWVELKSPDRWPEGIDPAKKEEFGDLGRYSKSALADALKYEGDTMGHCVGGYCDDVASGRSRIYSLRDAKGQPHVTIEVQPPAHEYPVSGEEFAMLPQETKDRYRAITAEWRKSNPDDPEVWKALAEAGVEPTPPRIFQIKGKQNRAPNPEYLPFVQDFVKSGKWSDVGDLQNAGLIHRTSLDRAEIAKAKPDQQWFTPEEIDSLYDDVRSRIETGEKFATGGTVQPKKGLTLQDLSAIISALQSGNQHGPA